MSWNRGKSAITTFRNFDLEVYGYRRVEEQEQVQVRVVNSPAGGQGPDDHEVVVLPGRLRGRIRQLEHRDLDFDGLVHLGEDLAAILLPLKARQLYNNSLHRLDEREGLRIRLSLGSLELATLPWEYAYVDPGGVAEGEKTSLGFLALNRRVSLVRDDAHHQAPQSLEPLGDEALRLIAVTAQPAGTAGLSLEQESERIRNAASEVPGLHFVGPHSTWQQVRSELNQAAHILHFAGHGDFRGEMGASFGSEEGSGVLLFEADDGSEDSRPAQDVATNLSNSGTRLVVLAACESARGDDVRAWSSIARSLTRSGIPAVVAMQFKVRDDKALAFSTEFYRSLAAGNAIDAAVTAGRLAMFDSNDSYGRDWGAPIVYLNAQGVLFPSDRAPGDRQLTPRFKVNVGLAAAVLLLAIAYYLLHWSLKFSNLYVVAGGASLTAAISLVITLVDRLVGTSIVSSLAGWLGRGSATKFLTAAVVAIVGVGAATSSFYVIPDEGGGLQHHLDLTSEQPALGEKGWPVHKRPKGKVLLGSIWRPQEVTVKPGRGFRPRTATLRPGWSTRCRIPDDFERRRILRLVPTPAIWNKVNSGAEVKIRLTINGRKQEIIDLPVGSWVIGDRPQTMRDELLTDRDRLVSELRTYLDENQVPEGQREDWVNKLSNHWTDRDIELRSADEIRIEVTVNGVSVFTKPFAAGSNSTTVTNVFLG